MKNGFGSFMVLAFLLAVPALAAGPNETPFVSTVNDCNEPMGFISGYTDGVNGWVHFNFVVLGSHPNGGYYSQSKINDSGLTLYGSYRVDWDPENFLWRDYYSNALSISSCLNDFYLEMAGKSMEDLQDIPGLYDAYFPTDEPEGRYDRTSDDDGDGMPDYYDLDCPRYDEYLEYCEANGIKPLDLVDYQYFQDHPLDEYLELRQNMNDTDGDGFSDGYETIHGTSMYDGSNYPLGLPDTGESLLIVGGVAIDEPWRLEQYNDSGYSRGFVYDHGFDPFGTEDLTFEEAPDWGLLDSDNDGLLNYAELANGTDPFRFEFQSGFSYVYDEEGGFYYVTGYTEDGAFGDYGSAPTEEDWLAMHEDYEIGDYAYNPSEYEFGNAKYDGLLGKTSRIKFDCDNVRPQTQRDYKLYFTLPIPGEGTQTFGVSVMPDTGTPAGAAMEVVRQLIRGMCGVIFSYVFIKHVWLAIRQY